MKILLKSGFKDETSFRIGILGGERVVVPCTAKQLYTPSPENWLSITILETVSVAGGLIPLVYSKPRPTTPPTTPLTLPLYQLTPKPSSFKDLEQGLQRWKAKLTGLLSSPSQKSYENWHTGTEEVLASGQLQQLDLQVLQQQVGGKLCATRALELRAAKAELLAQKAQAKEARVAQQAANQVRRQLRGLGVEARKQERLRKKKVRALTRAGNPIPPEDQDPIPDPEAGSEASSEAGSEVGSEPDSEAGSERGGSEPEPEPGFEPRFERAFELELEPGFELEVEPGSGLASELQRRLEEGVDWEAEWEGERESM
ncbi:hypothetical protein V495_05785 [Pseudogymnoascus sp. VKM F-4514 (FW-929)]|nr:hypothetical protein V495_05785 [Pseudogymnoascus sp. VKM F-4514 (FW-929)]KFY62273.1 hypothetical protein V497_02482 [Pseudogymnoascus sp. VKM F-4516 (FW-969)]